jgi:dTDP-4-dehydrorhamnose reductase
VGSDRRFLILGASGFIGRHLARRLGDHAIGTYDRNPFPGGVPFDLESHDIGDILRAERSITHVFILLGPTSMDQCARESVASQRSWVERMKGLISKLVDAGRVPVLASSDAVFDGERGRYTEKDTPRPILTYGRQKLALERHLSETTDRYLITRFSKVVGGDRGTKSLLGEWLEALENPAPIRCAYDQAFSPIFVRDATEGIARLVERGCTGLYHVGGPSRFTRLELCTLLDEEVRKHRTPRAAILSCSIRSFDFVEDRPLDTSIDSTRLYRDTSLAPASMEAVCRSLASVSAEAR